MADIHWLNAVNGDFNTGTNWSGGTVPGISDNAILGVLGGTPYTVTESPRNFEQVHSVQVAANATLVVGYYDNFQALYGGANAGTINVDGGHADLLLGNGSFSNSGSISLGGVGGAGQLILASSTLNGGGQVILNNSRYGGGSIALYGSSVNVDNTISGGGSIDEGSAGATLTNGAAGVIDATNTGALFISNHPITNNGLIEATGTVANTFLDIRRGANVDQSGGGTILAANGATVDLEQVSISGGTLSSVGTGVFDIGFSNTVLDGSASPLIDKATINVTAGYTTGQYEATLKGAIANSGIINVLGARQTGNQTNLIIDPAGVTLTGAGSINLVTGVASRVGYGTSQIVGAGAGSVLTNVDNTISGTGGIGAGQLTVVNQGVIDASASKALFMVGSVVNGGLIEATVGALVAEGTISNAGGVIEANGGRVLLNGADIAGGTVESAGGSSLSTEGAGTVLDGTAHVIRLSGALTVAGATTLTAQGAIDNGGRIDLASSASHPGNTDLIVGAAGATLSGGGQVVLTPAATNRIYGASGAATLTNADNRISGAGMIGDGVLKLVNDAAGAIIGNSAAGLTLNTAGSPIVNAGLIDAAGAGVVIIDSAVANSGVLETQGGAMKVNGQVTGASGEAIVNGGRLDFVSGFSQRVVFGANGALELDQSQSFGGTVYGFSRTGANSIDLRDISFASATYTLGGNAIVTTLTVMDGTHTTTIRLRGDYRTSSFNLASDGHGGTIVTDPTKAGSGLPPAHAFVAAMAGLGAGAAAGTHATLEAWRASAPILVGPRVQMA